MLIKTKCFGEIDLREDKIITFDNGIMGFEDFKDYTLIYNIENENNNTISWLQSIDEPALAIPVINPLVIKEDYNPTVNDDVLKPLGELNDDNLVVLLTITVPNDLEKMTANLKAPFVINSESRKGCQIIVENQDYQVKCLVYEQIQLMKEKKGE